MLCALATLREAFLSALLLSGISTVHAQSSVSFAPVGDETADFETQVLLSDLDNPVGLALRPTQAKRGPYELYFAESGAGRIVRVVTDAPEQVDGVIVDFPLNEQLGFRTGPLGLAFINRKKLVVGLCDGGENSGKLVSYALGEAGAVVDAGERDHAVGPLRSKLDSGKDRFYFFGLAMTEGTCYVTSSRLGTEGLVLKAGVRANRLAYLQPLIDVEKEVGFGAPGGIAVIPRPRPAFLVVALMGSRETPQDSRLVFFVPSTGKVALSLPTGLHDILSLAYSPSGQLYAADFSWQDAQAGGVYRLDDARVEGKQTCRAVKIASVVRPVSLAFAPDGSLFVTALGAGENARHGMLVKVTGEL